MASVHVIISGDVQGVGYRYWLSQEARKANLHGWVRNTAGKVEALLSGDEAAVAALVERCKFGPAAAKVTDLESRAAPESDEPGFRILPDRL